MKLIKLTSLFLILFNSFIGKSQCNTSITICEPGITDPFTFSPPSTNPSSCLDFTNGIGANYAYITIYITTSGPLNLLIDSPTVTTGFIDVAIFDITGQTDPCGSLSVASEIGCNYASTSSGCNQFGNDFPCASSVASPIVTAGDVLMILVEDWSNGAGSFTLELGGSPGSAQTGPGNPTITSIPVLSTTAPITTMTAVDAGGVWSSSCGTCIDPVTGSFSPTLAGAGTHQICYDLGITPCDSSHCIDVIVEAPCALTAISVNQNISCPSLTYNTTGLITFTDPPASGTLTITDCNGNNQVLNPPFISPLNYTITGQNADGLSCDVLAVFSDQIACTNSVNYTAPICPCNITDLTTTQSACSLFNNTFTSSGTISFDMPPSTGNLTITVMNSTSSYDTIINSTDFISPLSYSISGIESDGSNSTITATFSANGSCISALNFVSPINCSCNTSVGSTNSTMIGSGNSNFVLCWGDNFSYASNGDYIEPNNVNIGTFNPGIGYAVYSCPPTPDTEPNLDQCFQGIIATGTGNFIFNDVNDLTTIGSYPSGTFTDEIIYYVPITMYDITSSTYSVSSPPCYDIGTPIAVQYLPEILSVEVEDCQNGSITSTITGGIPELDGSNYTIVPGSLFPSNASFLNTSTSNGGTITINGLTNGQTFSYNITDANGCPISVSGIFIGIEDASFSYNSLVLCQADTDPILNVTGDTGIFGFTVNSGGPTLSINTTTGAVDVSASDPGVYTITYTTNDPFCFSTLNVTMTIQETPIVNPIINQTVCNTIMFSDVITTGTIGSIFNWSNTNTTIGIPSNGTGDILAFSGTNTSSIQTSSTIMVTPILATCTGTSILFDLNVNPSPTIDAGTDLTVCELSGPITLTATNPDDATLVWDNSVTDGVAFNPTSGTLNYTVTGDLLGCISTDNVNITVNPLPTINAGLDQTICENENTTLTATNPDGATLSWNNAVTDGVAFISPIGTTNYTVTANLSGCISTDNVNITVNPLPTINAGLDQTICENENTTLTATNPDGATLSWNNAVTDGMAFISPIGTTNYNVTANLSGCISTDNVNITVNPLPTFTVIGTHPTTCGSTDGFITISGLLNATNYQISYNNGAVQGPTAMLSNASGEIIITGLNAGNYTDFIVNVLTCSTIDNTVINLVDALTPTIDAGIDLTICENENTTLTATNPDGATLSWNNAVTDGVAFISPIGTTNYTVTATLLTCVSTDDVDITVNLIPIVTFEADTLTACLSSTITFTNQTSIGSVFEWDFGDETIGNGTIVSHNYIEPGVFDISLTVTTAEGCTATVTIYDYISIDNPPIANFSLDPQFTDINHTEIEFTNESELGEGYEWDFGDNSDLVYDEHTSHIYDAVPAQYPISLLVTSNNGGCSDLIVKYITINDVLLYFVPNAFTPGNGNLNLTFKPIFTSGFDINNYKMTIYNRWGELLFESQNHEIGWNGTFTVNGETCITGVYIWKIDFNENTTDKRQSIKGHVTLLR